MGDFAEIASLAAEGRYEPDHPVFEAPETESTIWRYVDFTKLVSLLETQRLFFARSSTLDDPFEGSTSRFNVAARPHVYRTGPFADDPDSLGMMLRSQSEVAQRIRDRVFVNCWTLSPHENAALWGLYAPAAGGIAIQSTFGRLRDAFVANVEREAELLRVHIGRVQYVDYDTEWIPEDNLLSPFVHKRRSFAFESELRALILKMPGTAEQPAVIDWNQPVLSGLNIAVDLNRLISALYVAPTAPAWFAGLVESVARRYACSVPVMHSDLRSDPVY